MAVLYEAKGRTIGIPNQIVSDGMMTYPDAIERVFGADSEHIRAKGLTAEINTNIIERFHGTVKERTKVMRGLRTIETARKFLDGWLVHYNFFRPHTSLKDMTPSLKAGIKFPFRNWKDVVEQPIEVTARIPITRKAPRITPKTPRISQKVGKLT